MELHGYALFLSSHFTGKGKEAQRGQGLCLELHSLERGQAETHTQACLPQVLSGSLNTTTKYRQMCPYVRGISQRTRVCDVPLQAVSGPGGFQGKSQHQNVNLLAPLMKSPNNR